MPDSPVSGHDMGVRRIALGLSGLSVARELGIAPATLLFRERRLDPLSAGEAKRWTSALTAAARKRAQQLARQGFSELELPMPLRRELKLG